jgi:hypothetical protein
LPLLGFRTGWGICNLVSLGAVEVLAMAALALVAWLVTAAGGGAAAARWLAEGGARRRVPVREAPVPVPAGPPVAATRTRFTAPLVEGLAALSVAGPLLWAAYLVTNATVLGVLSLLALLALIGLGEVLFLRWLGGRAGGESTIESRFPAPLVVGHGLAGLATLVFVSLALLGVGS